MRPPPASVFDIMTQGYQNSKISYYSVKTANSQKLMDSTFLRLYPHRTADAVLESENDPQDTKNWRRPDSMLVLKKRVVFRP